MSDIIKKAKKIAIRDLRDCYHGEGVFASLKNFTDYWARDTFWASFGMLEIGDWDRVKRSLELFSQYQKPNGKIPRKITHHYTRLKYLGIKIKRKKFKPVYKGVSFINYSMDDNLLFVIAFCHYIEKSKDTKFATDYYQDVHRALTFYVKEKFIHDNLLQEDWLCNWMDTIYKKGFVLYTNCLWFKAVEDFEKLTQALKRNNVESALPSSREINKSFQQKFSTKNHPLFKDKTYFFFTDLVNKKNKKDFRFDLAGNMLAIIFDLATKKQAEEILKITDRLKKKLTACVHPLYPFNKIQLITYIGGISRYQNGISWSWIEAMLIAAKTKTKKHPSAKKDALTLSKIFLKNNNVHETYFLDGRPFDHFLWKSAVPFAWGAGLFIWATSKMKK